MTSQYQPVAAQEILATFAGPITIWVGDTLPDLDIYLSYDSGGYLDLMPSGVAAQCTAYISRYGGTKMVTSGICLVVEAAKGHIALQSPYVWRTPGLYEGQVRIRFGTDPPGYDYLSSQKFLIHVRKRTPDT